MQNASLSTILIDVFARGAALALLCGGVCSVAGAQVTFTERAIPSGIDALHNNTLSFVKNRMSGGGVWADFDRDGDQDIFIVSGNFGRDKLYLNDGAGAFTEVAATAGVNALHVGVGASAADYNNDGLLDIYVTSLGPPGGAGPGFHKLYRNDGVVAGVPRFTEVAAAAGVNVTSPARDDGLGAGWGDYDSDGDLDLAVAGWFNNSGGNVLFRNNGNGTFTNVTTSILFNMAPLRAFGPLFIDTDNDLDQDLYWMSDFDTEKFFTNNGNGTFSETTAAVGLGQTSNGMGLTYADFNNDGYPDFYATSIWDPTQPLLGWDGNKFYLSDGDGSYTEQATPLNLFDGGWGWGTVAIDFDHNGHLDIFETNGWDPGFIGEQCYLWMNSGSLTFTESAAAAGVNWTGMGRGMAWADYDNDGDPDVAVFGFNEKMRLFRNETPAAPSRAWLIVDLNTQSDTRLAPDGFGSRISVTANGITRHQWISGSNGYLTTSQLAAHFGLATATTIDEVRVRWANGRDTAITNVGINQHLTIDACPADGTGDGQVDSGDLAAFIVAFISGVNDPTTDLNNDGQVDSGDLAAFINHFLAGC
jgi:hypothetical protein